MAPPLEVLIPAIEIIICIPPHHSRILSILLLFHLFIPIFIHSCFTSSFKNFINIHVSPHLNVQIFTNIHKFMFHCIIQEFNQYSCFASLFQNDTKIHSRFTASFKNSPVFTFHCSYFIDIRVSPHHFICFAFNRAFLLQILKAVFKLIQGNHVVSKQYMTK